MMATYLLLLLLIYRAEAAILSYDFPDSHINVQASVVAKTTGELFVGSKNTLYKFEPNLKLEEEIHLGPLLDHPECYYPVSSPCSHTRILMDFDIKIMDIVYHLEPYPLLFLCSDLYHGLCQLRPLHDLHDVNWIEPYNETVGFVVKSGIAASTFSYWKEKVTLFSETYTHHHNNRWGTLSRRVLAKGNETYFFSYSFKNEAKVSEHEFPRSGEVLPLVIFADDEHVYFVRSVKLPSASSFVTEVGRICIDDTTFISYTKAALSCEFDNKVAAAGVAAYITEPSQCIKNLMKKKIKDHSLYVSFVNLTQVDHGNVFTSAFVGLFDKFKRPDNIICVFPLHFIDVTLTAAAEKCLADEKRSMRRMSTGSTKLFCEKEVDVVVDNGFCGSTKNPHIISTDKVPGLNQAVYHNVYTTQLVITVQKNKTVFIGMTNDVRLRKKTLDKDGGNEVIAFSPFCPNHCRMMSHSIYNSLGCDTSCDNYPSQHSTLQEGKLLLDHLEQSVYLLIKNKIVKWNISSCSVYVTCNQCLRTGAKDSLKCTWCNNKCTLPEECRLNDRLNVCAPVIENIVPQTVPFGGSTSLTISGSSFGPQSVKSFVSVGDQTCLVMTWNSIEITCTISGVRKISHEMLLPVFVNISTRVLLKEVSHFGTNREGFLIKYVQPQLYGVFPEIGPNSGGSNVSFYGKYLKVGKDRHYNIGQQECRPISYDPVSENVEKVNCLTKRSAKSGINSCDLTLVIDDARITTTDYIPGNPSDPSELNVFRKFIYVQDPEIHSISPKKSTFSGGYNLTITGTNLNSVLKPKMVVNLKLPDHSFSGSGEGLTEFTALCTLMNSTSMTCPTPSLKHMTSLFFKRQDTVFTYISFIMDGVEKLLNFPATNPRMSLLPYYPDPELYEAKLFEGQNLVEITGAYVDLFYSEEDFRVTIDNSENCRISSISAEKISCIFPNTLIEKDLKNISLEVHAGSLKHSIFYVEKIDYVPEKINYAREKIDYAQEKNDSVQEKNDSVQEKNDSVQEKNDSVQEKNDSVQEKNDSVQESNWNTIAITGSICLVSILILITLYCSCKGGKCRRKFSCRKKHVPKDTKDSLVPLKEPENGRVFHKYEGAAPISIAFVKKGANSALSEEQNIVISENIADSGHFSQSETSSSSVNVNNISQSKTEFICSSLDKWISLIKKNNMLIEEECIVLGEKFGSGFFGVVHKGELRCPKEEVIDVAIKFLLSPNETSDKEVEAFITEGISMQSFNHDNVLCCLGIGFIKQQPAIIMPFMAEGDLRSYLMPEHRNFTCAILISYAIQIAAGMTYLSQRNFIHRDLAARNCLLDENLRVKISDFGMCRVIQEGGYYRPHECKQVPFRWLAPESMQKQIYTSETDVWTYGIVLFEIMTRGEMPYYDMSNNEIPSFLMRGNRLPKPRGCPTKIYQVMQDCWNIKPNCRPSFESLEERMEEIYLENINNSKPFAVNISNTLYDVED